MRALGQTRAASPGTDPWPASPNPRCLASITGPQQHHWGPQASLSHLAGMIPSSMGPQQLSGDGLGHPLPTILPHLALLTPISLAFVQYDHC